ncbi:MAG: DUF427 domain-containing protein [Phenylobacterium sp.]|uniref:DUF427 domain-containing protein n=1 Tax=Phenylobacterium sp. TaxID=1871053 RepID=UPI0027283608|nr:DUF427 domain-containing protein [Phenylobacterium sp.]MDO8902825.1 DUF427 domain-containing protein [Phenylobacterium sp.]
MSTPGSNHALEIRPAATRMRAAVQGHIIADSDNVLMLKEGAMAPVAYFPRDDIEMGYFARTDRSTHCPFKGDAAYYTVTLEGEVLENVAWTYEDPLPGAVQIDGRVAFYADRVEVYGVGDDVAPHDHHTDVDAVVQHTDSGGGQSQKAHWPTNVEEPKG